jgi:hypothetical protein
MSKVASVPTISLKLRLPENIYDNLAERATKYGRDVEDEIAFRLRDTLAYTASQPIYLDDNARNELTQLAGTILRTQDDVLRWARKQTSLNIGHVDVPLTTLLADRLRSRCFGRTWAEHITRVVTESLEQYVGMR